ncbi:MAG: glutamate--tRNA ligase family protein, partial [Sphingomicrobium sp.]
MIVTRFAPSPTGRLHLGHAFSAVVGHARARDNGGRFLVRIEDLDPGRSRPEFVDGIFEDLAWLGLEWDEPVLVQSQRSAHYDAALATLRER